MLSLVFICAQKVVSDHASIRRALDFIPDELYPVLFKAAFLGKKTLVLQDLVQRWPYSVLCFQAMLKDSIVIPGQSREKPSKLCVQAVILGVMAYLSDALTRQKDGSPAGKARLRLLDMTGTHDDGLEPGPEAMSLWSHTVALAKACIDSSKQHMDVTMQVSKRRRGPCHAAHTPPPPGDSVYVQVRVDLFVNSTSFGVLREALLVSAHSPLRLQCRDLRAEELSLRSSVALLELLNPAPVRQIDLRFNNLGLTGLNVLLLYVTKFNSLQSLKLPYSNIDVRRLSPTTEEAMQNFASQIGLLSSLKELNLGSSRISGRLRQLLSGLQTPLESLELAFCYLLPVDLSYLSQSIHVSALRRLDFSGNNLSALLLHPFQRILRLVSASLLHLDIMECKVTDAHLAVLLPSLCSCSHLRQLGLFCNPLSSQGIKMLLLNCVHMPELQLVVYPLPLDCCTLPWPVSSAALLDSVFDQEKLQRVGAELQELLVRAERTDITLTTDMCMHRQLDDPNL